jgi:hypothetical protein
MGERGKLSRRGFVGAAAGTAAATSLGPWAPAAVGRGDGDGGDRLLPRDLIGVQLFTVRDQVSSLGFDAVFAELSEQGYNEIEFAGYNAQGRRWTNEELRALLRRYRLRGVGSHVNYFSANPMAYTFVTQLAQVLDDAEEIGLQYIGTASSPGQPTARRSRATGARPRTSTASGRPRGRAGWASTSTTTRASSPSRTAPGCTT